MHLRRRGLDGDGLGRAAGRRRFGLSLLLHGVVVGHAPVGHLRLTLRHHTHAQSVCVRIGCGVSECAELVTGVCVCT